MTASTAHPGLDDVSRRYVVPLNQLRASDLPRAGGKGANLGELLGAGFSVPDGFCVTTNAYTRFVEGVPDLDALLDAASVVQGDDVRAVRKLGRQLRTVMGRSPMPPAVEDEIGRAWRERDPATAYAVRSSATAEDLPDASFAGQQETVLDVRGEEALQHAVRHCWTSLFTDRAIVYRARNGFDSRAVRLAVVVQPMVHAEASGVLFTVDPVSQHRPTMVIDAVHGVGEALVGGQVTPDSYRIDRRDPSLLRRSIGQRSDGSVEPVLADDRVRDLALLGQRVETHFGAPQDLEWAVEHDRIVLLQARPITSLYPVETLRSPDGSLRVYFSVGHQQSMTRALPPLSRSTLLALLPGGHDRYGQERTVLHTAGGRLYLDLTAMLRRRVTRRGVFAALSQMDALAPRALTQAMERPEFRGRPRPRPSLRRLGQIARVALGVPRTIAWADLRGLRGRTEARMDAFEAEARRRIEQARAGRERGEAALAVLRSTFPFLLTIAPLAAAGIASTRLLTRLGRRWLNEDEREALSLGLPGNAVNEMNLAIDDLAQLARRSPDVVHRLATIPSPSETDARPWRATLERVEGGPDFLAALDAFLARYGARGPSEIDASMPRWREDPRPVLTVIAAAIERDGPSYRDRVARFEADREEAFGHLLARAERGPLGRVRGPLLNRLYRVMVEVGGMREHHKFMAVRILAAVKDVIAEAADQLHGRGAVDRPDDVWFVPWPRLLDALDDATVDLRPGLVEAREAFARDQRRTPPMVVTSDGEIPQVDRGSVDAPEGALLGQSVSVGVVEGVVRVVRDPARDELEPGEILVAEFTDPGWTPLFMNAAGLVLEVGGVLTHGAVVAREYGIPAVVGVRGATSTLRTGQRVRIDGVRGFVEVLAREPETDRHVPE